MSIRDSMATALVELSLTFAQGGGIASGFSGEGVHSAMRIAWHVEQPQNLTAEVTCVPGSKRDNGELRSWQ